MTGVPQHVTVLRDEAVAALAVKEGGIYVDATFGRGGHSRQILGRLGETGRLIALDRDPQAVEAARGVQDSRFAMVHAPFGELAQRLVDMQVGEVDGVLFDLGVSSPQLDQPERGFSFRFDAPLDMRMDTTCGMTAADWLATAGQDEIREVIRNYGEERFAQQIAKTIVATRASSPLRRTGELARLVAQCVRTREPGQDPATRTFQALRIHINQELAELSLTLPQARDCLKPGGRLVVISFHSLEDRIVKRFIADEARPPSPPSRIPLRADQLPQPRMRMVGKPVRPSDAECKANPRARSAIMRVAEKV